MHTNVHILQICFDCGNIICGIGPSSVKDGGSGQNWGNGDGGRMEEEEENPTVVKSRTYAKHSFEKLNMQNTVGKTQTFASHIGETKPYNEEEVNLGGSLGQAGIESEIGMTNPTFG